MHFSRIIERTFSATEQPRLLVTHARGALAVEGEDREDIQVTATLHLDTLEADGERYLAQIEVPMSQEGDAVVIGPAEYDEDDEDSLFGQFFGLARRPRVDIDVRVPRRCTVQAWHRAGPTSIHGIRADVHAESRTGRVGVEDVDGEVTVESRTGMVEVRHVRGNATIDCRTGRVEIEEVQGALSCTNRTGQIQARDCAGPFRFNTHTGAVTYRGPVEHGGAIEVDTGAITLAVPRNAHFFLDAASERGSVRSGLAVDEQRSGPPDEAPTVRLRASTGSIRVLAR